MPTVHLCFFAAAMKSVRLLRPKKPMRTPGHRLAFGPPHGRCEAWDEAAASMQTAEQFNDAHLGYTHGAPDSSRARRCIVTFFAANVPQRSQEWNTSKMTGELDFGMKWADAFLFASASSLTTSAKYNTSHSPCPPLRAPCSTPALARHPPASHHARHAAMPLISLLLWYRILSIA